MHDNNAEFVHKNNIFPFLIIKNKLNRVDLFIIISFIKYDFGAS